MKKILALAVLFAIILSIWTVGLASATYPDRTGTPSTMTVHKFNDENGNGAQDPGEEGVEGWLFRIYRWDFTGSHMVAEGHTGPGGIVTFSGLAAPSRYKVWEEKRDCWAPTALEGLISWSQDEQPGNYTAGWLDQGIGVVVKSGIESTCGE